MQHRGHAYLGVDRPNPDRVALLKPFGVATLQQAMAGSGLLAPLYRPLLTASRNHLIGPAVTGLNHDGDNLAVHRVLPLVESGDVIVLTSDGTATGAIWGEIVTIVAQTVGAAGALIDGPVRDVADIRELSFPVWYRSISAANAVKETLTGVNTPVVVGGVLIHPGDVVVADDDGVVVVPQSEIENVAAKAQALEDKEEGMRARVRAGEFLYDFLGYEERLRRQGIVEHPGPVPR